LYSNKYEVALKEKMLLKLEKDRLVAKVENMELSLKQMEEDKPMAQAESPNKSTKAKEKALLKITGVPSVLPKERANPNLLETYEPAGAHLSC